MLGIPRRIVTNKVDSRQYIQQALAAAAELDQIPVARRSAPIQMPRQAQGEPVGGVPVTGGPASAVLDKAIRAMIAESGGKIKIVSGKRSTKRQAELYAAAVKKYGPKNARKWAAPPGRSKHERGEAYDLGGDLKLAAQLAQKYGLYRPMAHEPWHFELVGSRGKAHKH